jgi:hypothetical protein
VRRGATGRPQVPWMGRMAMGDTEILDPHTRPDVNPLVSQPASPYALAVVPDGCRPDEIGALSTQPHVPIRRLPLRPGQLRCLKEIASAFGDRPFTRADVATLSDGVYVRSEDSVLRQLVQHHCQRRHARTPAVVVPLESRRCGPR